MKYARMSVNNTTYGQSSNSVHACDKQIVCGTQELDNNERHRERCGIRWTQQRRFAAEPSCQISTFRKHAEENVAQNLLNRDSCTHFPVRCTVIMIRAKQNCLSVPTLPPLHNRAFNRKEQTQPGNDGYHSPLCSSGRSWAGNLCSNRYKDPCILGTFVIRSCVLNGCGDSKGYTISAKFPQPVHCYTNGPLGKA